MTDNNSSKTERVLLNRLEREAEMTYHALNEAIAELEAAKTRMLEGKTPGWGIDGSLNDNKFTRLMQHVQRVAELSRLAGSLIEDPKAIETAYSTGIVDGMSHAERKALEDEQD